MIQAVNIFRKYNFNGVEQLALRDVSLSIPTGKSIALIGRSGSGKSTLLHTLSGLDTPDWGKVIIDNVQIQKLRKRQKDILRNKHIGFIFQSFFLLPKETVWQNIALPLEIAGSKPEERRLAAMQMLELVDMKQYADHKAYQLSGGQKQRICIARAIINFPQYIFADEPTGNLDPKTAEIIENLLFTIHKTLGSTLILVTHNLSLAAKCDGYVELEDGIIIRQKGF